MCPSVCDPLGRGLLNFPVTLLPRLQIPYHSETGKTYEAFVLEVFESREALHRGALRL